MKNLMLGMTMIGMGILFLAIILTLTGRMTRADESNQALDQAVTEAVENAMNQKNGKIKNREELTADILENLLVHYNNNADFEIKIHAADEKKGILSLTVCENYVNPGGKEGHYRCTKTVVMEQVNMRAYKTVTYQMTKNEVWKQFKVQEEEKIPVPETPAKDGKCFVGWEDIAAGSIYAKETLEKQTVSKDTVYRAVYR